jgi:hypothetical protein
MSSVGRSNGEAKMKNFFVKRDRVLKSELDYLGFETINMSLEEVFMTNWLCLN